MSDLPDDDPFSALLTAHADFIDKLTELEATLDEMMATREAREANLMILDESLRFFDDELGPLLHAEDETILPRLEAAIGRYGTLVSIIASEHDEVRRGVEKLREARDELQRQPRSWGVIQEVNRHGIFLVQFLWDHFRKERVSLLPTARERLSSSDLAAIRRRFTQ